TPRRVVRRPHLEHPRGRQCAERDRVPGAGEARACTPRAVRLRRRRRPDVHGAADPRPRPVRGPPPQPVRSARPASRCRRRALHRLYVVDAAGGTPRRLTDGSAGEFQPAWSRDGEWIAYATWSDREGAHIYRVRARGGSAQRLTTGTAYYQQPAFSPDGARVV